MARKKRTKKSKLISIIFIGIIFLLVYYINSRPQIDSGFYNVVRVVDGDTIIIDMDGKEERVRLIGIDTPESVHPDKEKNVSFGKVATNFTEDNLLGKNISLEKDVTDRDKYNRLLRYVYIDELMFNEILVAEGMAIAKEYGKDTKYSVKFQNAMEAAKKEKKGMWADEIEYKPEEIKYEKIKTKPKQVNVEKSLKDMLFKEIKTLINSL